MTIDRNERRQHHSGVVCTCDRCGIRENIVNMWYYIWQRLNLWIKLTLKMFVTIKNILYKRKKIRIVKLLLKWTYLNNAFTINMMIIRTALTICIKKKELKKILMVFRKYKIWYVGRRYLHLNSLRHCIITYTLIQRIVTRSVFTKLLLSHANFVHSF